MMRIARLDYMSGSKEIFKRRLRIARKAAGFTQASLAEAIEKSEDTVSSWERGKREIQMDDLDLVARACGYPPPWFITDDGEEKSAELDEVEEAYEKLGQKIASLKAIRSQQPRSLIRSSRQRNKADEWRDLRPPDSPESTKSGDP